MKTISNYISHVKPITAFGAFGMLLLQLLFTFLLAIPMGIIFFFLGYMTPTSELIWNFLLLSVLTNVLANFCIAKIYCKPHYPQDTTKPIPTNTKLFLYLGIFMIGYSIFRLGSLDRIIEILPLGSFIEDIMINTAEEWSNTGMVGTVIMFLEICVLAPLFEEYLHRGIILTALSKRYSAQTSIIVSALLFGMMHGNLPQFFNATIIGLILGTAFYYTRNLWLVIFMHAIYNFSTIVIPIYPETLMEKGLLFLLCVPIGIGMMYFVTRKTDLKGHIQTFKQLNTQPKTVELVAEESIKPPL